MFRRRPHPASLIAKEILNQNPLFIDTETTGKRPIDVIVEIAVVDIQGNIIFNSLINPKRRIPKDSTKIHLITNQIVENAPTWPEVWTFLETVFKDRLICSYNIDYDWRLLKQSTKRAKMQWHLKNSSTFCVMKLFAYWYGEWSNYHKDYTYQSLEFAQKYCNIKGGPSHRALNDALGCVSVLKYIAENHPRKGFLEKVKDRIHTL